MEMLGMCGGRIDICTRLSNRVRPSEGRGHRFESCRARHYNQDDYEAVRVADGFCLRYGLQYWNAAAATCLLFTLPGLNPIDSVQ